MANDIKVRFVLTSGNVDFYEGEITEETKRFLQDFETQLNQKGSPVVFEPGDEWESLEINFKEYTGLTRAKVDQLIDAKEEMTLYYAYAYYTTTKSIDCIYRPGKTQREYNYALDGEAEVTIHKLTFLKTG